MVTGGRCSPSVTELATEPPYPESTRVAAIEGGSAVGFRGAYWDVMTKEDTGSLGGKEEGNGRPISARTVLEKFYSCVRWRWGWRWRSSLSVVVGGWILGVVVVVRVGVVRWQATGPAWKL